MGCVLAPQDGEPGGAVGRLADPGQAAHRLREPARAVMFAHDERGWTLAEQTETPEGVKVTIHNCPFRNTALKFPQVCTITPHLMSRLLGTAVSQADSIHRHDPYCSFVVQRAATTE